MQPLRRWLPEAARKDDLSPADVLGKDMAFCAEFAVHGGVAVSKCGFKAEAALLRMHQAGLLNLGRDPVPPFAVVRVTLSAAARDLLLSEERRTVGVPTPASRTTPALGAARDPTSDRGARRNGFEVARGMISSAIKAELSCPIPDLDQMQTAALAARIIGRISQIQLPF